jgi:FkbM family methyltransferase
MSDILFRRATRFSRRMVINFARVCGLGRSFRRVPLKWEYGWKAEVIHQILKISDGDFIDVGANIGQTLLDFNWGRIGGRYLGFEPNPASFVSLFELVEEKKINNCLILPVGLFDATKVLNLGLLPHTSTDVSASVVPNLRPARKKTVRPVVCCRFDDIRSDLGITSIGLIKIDVEGAELFVLRGMEVSLRTMRSPILCEILYADAHADILHYEANLREIERFLDEIKYDIFRILMDQSGKRFVGLLKVSALPIKVWALENAHECDYVLIPSEKINIYEGLIVAGGRGL